MISFPDGTGCPAGETFRAEEVRAITQTPDGLLQCAINHYHGFSIWVLSKKLSAYSFPNTINSGEWILRQSVKYSDLSLKYPTIMSLATVPYDPHAWGISLKAFHPQDSRIVYFRIARKTKICCYHLETQGLELVKYHGKAKASCLYNLFPYVQCAWPGSLPRIGTTNSTSRSSFHQRKRFTSRRSAIPVLEERHRWNEKEEV